MGRDRRCLQSRAPFPVRRDPFTRPDLRVGLCGWPWASPVDHSIRRLRPYSTRDGGSIGICR